MNDQPQFATVLDEESMDTWEAPKPFPPGAYVCLVKGLPEYDKSSKKQTPFARFTLQPLQAMDDVDQQALADMGGFGNRTLRLDFYLTEDAKYRIKEFAQHCGIWSPGMSPRQALESCQGQQVVAVIKHRMSDDGRTFAEIARTAQVA